MDKIWVLVALIGLTISEKLDRTYLPPPGSKFAGGSPGAIDVPLGLPNETFLPDSGHNNNRQPEIAIGKDRIGPIAETKKFGSATSPPYQKNEPVTKSYTLLDSTRIPDIVFNSKFYSDKVTNIPYSDELKDNFEVMSSTLQPANVYNEIQGERVTNDYNNLENNADYGNYVINKKISDESEKTYGGDIDSIPQINSYSEKPFSSTIDNASLINYETDSNIDHSSASLIHTNIQEDPNYISSTPIYSTSSNLPDSLYPTISSQYVKQIPYTFSSQPDRIQAQRDSDAIILNYDNKITPDGYAYSFDTSNGIHVEEKGTALDGVRAIGSYSYIGNDGKLYNVSYTADENGFRPYGAHLPTAPPIPDAILKVIEQASNNRETGTYDDGSYDDNKYGYKNYEPNNKIKFLNKYENGGSKFMKTRPNFPKLDKEEDGELKTQNVNEKIFIIKNEMGLLDENDFNNKPLDKISNNYQHKSQYSNNDSNDYQIKEFQNSLTNTNIKDSEKKDNVYSTDVNNGSGYEYPKPHNDNYLETEYEFADRSSQTPDLKNDQKLYKEIDNNPTKPFMTPYVFQNDNTFLDYDNDDLFLNTSGRYQVQNQVGPSDQNTKKNLPDVAETKTDGTRKIDGDNGKTSIPFTDDQVYYPKKVLELNKDAYIPTVISTLTNLPEVSYITSTEFPSRFNTLGTGSESISINPSSYLDLSLVENETQIPNRSVGVEEKQKPLIPKNHHNIYNKNIARPADKSNDTVFKINSENLIIGEDFSGPKQVQRYDPLKGYYY